MTIYGAIGALIIYIVLLPTLLGLMDYGQTEVQKRQAADHLALVNRASADYVRKHQTTLLGQATASSGPVITVADLVTDELLPAGFQGYNIWRQNYQIYIRQPKAGNLQAVVLTTGGRGHEAGSKFATAIVPGTAALLGGVGGYIPTGDMAGQAADTLHGAGGGWVTSLASLGIPSPGAGHLGAMAIFDSSSLGQDFLYRVAVPGHKELNAMQTELDMTDHAIRNVSELQFQERQISDEACATPEDQGRIFLDVVQGLYICRNNSLEMIGDTGNSSLVRQVTLAKHGDTIIKPICPTNTNTVPMIFTAPALAEAGPEAPPISAFQTWATSLSDKEWQVQLRVLTPDRSLSTDNSGWVYPAADYGRIMTLTTCAKAVTP